MKKSALKSGITIQHTQAHYLEYPDIRKEIDAALESEKATFYELPRTYARRRGNKVSSCPVCLTDLTAGDMVTGIQSNPKHSWIFLSHKSCADKYGSDSTVEPTSFAGATESKDNAKAKYKGPIICG